MNQSEKIEQTILQKITPTLIDRRNLERIIKRVTEQVNKEIKKRRIPARTELVGSTAKDTFLRTTLDVDLFLLFPPETDKQYMADHTLAIGRTILENTEECYAEHPYIRGTYQGYKVELVPCYQIQHASQKLSSVDRTPLHTEYVKKHIKDRQKQEVLLFKQFLHGIGCYGAEASVEGFSGYLCEILIIQFNSFKDLLSRATTWKKGEKLSLLDEKIPDFPEILIVIDPVDPTRNVASAISKETFDRFQKASNAYLKNPSVTFFFPHPPIPWPLEKIQSTVQNQIYHYIGIQVCKPDIIDENLYPQIRKACRNIKTACTNYGFTIYDTTSFVDEKKEMIYLFIKTKKEPISEKQTHMGPPTNLEDHVVKFKEKWKNHPLVIQEPYITDNRWYVDVRREFTDIKAYISHILPTLRLGKHLETMMNAQVRILDGSDLFIDDLIDFWTRYLDEKESWEH
ncbi:MAG: CCA tRNA nucleotidyltransferase [Candidatus Thermoplasmatota archaeon]|nr:CCA tRNA nucleotidyltransferase [Candidatus Thermoplasmatota archaeon]